MNANDLLAAKLVADAQTMSAFVASNPQLSWFLAYQSAMASSGLPLTMNPAIAQTPATFPAFPFFTQSPYFSAPGIFTPTAAPSWMNQNQASTPALVTVKTEPKEVQPTYIQTLPTYKAPVIKAEKAEVPAISTSRPENPVWNNLWARNHPNQAPAQPSPFVQSELVQPSPYTLLANQLPAFMPSQPTLPAYSTDTSLVEPRRNYGDIPRWDVEADIEKLVATEFRTILQINVKDTEVFESHYPVAENRSYLELLKKGVALKKHPVYEKKKLGKRMSKKAARSVTGKRMKFEDGPLNLSLASRQDTSIVNLDDSYEDNEEEIVVGDFEYNHPAAPENDDDAALRKFYMKGMITVKEQKLTKYEIDLSKVEKNQKMARWFPQKPRSAIDQEKRDKNTESARLARLRNKAEQQVIAMTLTQSYVENIKHKRFIACAQNYINKLMELQNQPPMDISRAFEGLFLSRQAAQDVSPPKEATPELPRISPLHHQQ